MRFSLAALLLASALLQPLPAGASLPFYNPDLGYTIWLPGEWAEARPALLRRYAALRDGVGRDGGWTAGYALDRSGETCLLVSAVPGRVVSRADMANFNQFIIRGIQRAERAGCRRLREASFLPEKPMLRLVMDLDPARTSVVHLVYTRTGMLKFTGVARRGDADGVLAIDRAVASLYLDQGLVR
ncbi:hypothetical protein [Pseudodesulfovibrio sp.]|uniref:hypothetical protein n=1 Tax=Pseudodesulfovibrio sp. TaxID=2035812 RepID=UPI0026249853|nr:hypothetical protein [Pseudodesulfovibrio sp.]MDD3310798.1 hypothetical protein [Pseudodesulfovibrio sp.]